MTTVAVIALLGVPLSGLVPVAAQEAPVDEEVPSLSEVLADHFLLGAAIQTPRDLEGPESELLQKHVNSITAEYQMKWQFLQPEEGRWDWEATDALVDYADEHDMTVRGHTLIWHQSIPDWVFEDATGDPLTDSQEHQDLLLDRMETHITTVMQRYGDDVPVWDVVNEAVDESEPDDYRRTRWYDVLGPDYVAHAFEFARAADPHAQLYYNDYNTEFGSRRAPVHALLEDLIDDGVPVDGIGHQMHLTRFTDQNGIATTLELFESLGLDQAITELDVAVAPRCFPDDDCQPPSEVTAAQLDAQAGYYGRLFELFRAHDGIVSVTTWGIHDGDSWLQNWPQPQVEAPLLFDADHQAKPAFWAIVEAFSGAGPGPEPCPSDGALVTSSFEDGSEQGWVSATGVEQLTVSEQIARTGSRSLLVTDRALEYMGAERDLTDTVRPGGTYDIDLWLRRPPSTAPADLQVVAITRTGDDQDFEFLGSVSVGSDAWEPFSAAYEVPADADRVAIKVEGTAGAEFFVDDVTVIDPAFVGGGEPERSDEFDGDALDRCRWDRTVRYDPSKLEMTGGQLLVETPSGDIVEDAATEPENFILQSQPEGDWTVQTRFTEELVTGSSQAGLMVHADDDNYVTWGAVAGADQVGVDRIELRSEVDGQIADPQPTIEAPDNDGAWWLRLSRVGDEFLGEVSVDGVTWEATEQSVTNDLAADEGGVGIFTWANQDDPTTVAFDHVRFDDATPDPDPTDPDPTDPDSTDPDPTDPDPEHRSVCDRHQAGTTFPDAPGSGHREFIDCLAALGVVEGMTDGRFRPADDVSREQLASFVVRSIELATGELLEVGSAPFTDVDVNSTHGRAIAALHDAGIVRGYGDGTFQPRESVSRDQTARYVVNALELVLDAPLPRSGASFPDVAAGTQYAADIDALVTADVVSGFGDGRFGPRQPVTRGQMARFIGRALDVTAREGAYRGS